MANLPSITDETFSEEVLNTEGAVLLDFGAEWCHPCKQLDPIVRRAAELKAVVFQHTWLKTTGNLPEESTPMVRQPVEV